MDGSADTSMTHERWRVYGRGGRRAVSRRTKVIRALGVVVAVWPGMYLFTSALFGFVAALAIPFSGSSDELFDTELLDRLGYAALALPAVVSVWAYVEGVVALAMMPRLRSQHRVRAVGMIFAGAVLTLVAAVIAREVAWVLFALVGGLVAVELVLQTRDPEFTGE